MPAGDGFNAGLGLDQHIERDIFDRTRITETEGVIEIGNEMQQEDQQERNHHQEKRGLEDPFLLGQHQARAEQGG